MYADVGVHTTRTKYPYGVLGTHLPRGPARSSAVPGPGPVDKWGSFRSEIQPIAQLPPDLGTFTSGTMAAPADPWMAAAAVGRRTPVPASSIPNPKHRSLPCSSSSSSSSSPPIAPETAAEAPDCVHRSCRRSIAFFRVQTTTDFVYIATKLRSTTHIVAEPRP
jgi:hypothetical protein